AALSRTHWFWKSRGAAPFILLGTNSLAVYSVSILASYTAMGLASRWAVGREPFLGLTVVGIGILLLTAKISDSGPKLWSSLCRKRLFCGMLKSSLLSQCEIPTGNSGRLKGWQKAACGHARRDLYPPGHGDS